MKPYANCSPLFPVTKYSKWHDSIITRAKSEGRKKSKKKGAVYYESHHIVPASLGGADDSSNRVLLTAKEHFIVHLLLVKMFDGFDEWSKRKMTYAISRLMHDRYGHRKYTSAQYAISMRLHAKSMSEYQKGKQKSPNHVKSMSLCRMGKKRGSYSELGGIKISNALKGRVFTAEWKNKLSAAHENIQRLVCPHCGRDFKPNTYYRYHGDNCKLNPAREN